MTKYLKKKTEKQKEIINLVIARIDMIPSDKFISIGSEGEFTKQQLIEEVKNNSKIGQKVIEMQLEYLRLLKEGVLYGQSSGSN